MKSNKILVAIIVLLALVIIVGGLIFLRGKDKKVIIDSDLPPVKIGWSDWIGWMPWEIVKEQDLFGEKGANAELEYFDDYTASMQALKDGKVNALNVTINDALALKSSLEDLQIILINDVSDGGDGILAKKELGIQSVKELKGRIVSLEEGSVSHFLFLRALEENGVDPAEIEINNVSANLAGEAFLGSAFLDEKFTQVIVTWNPHLAKAKKEGKGVILFDSSQIYGEITDVLIARKSFIESRPQDFQAIIAAWYAAMEMIDSPKNSEYAIGIMAKKEGISSEEFESLMFDTEIFTKTKKALDFMGTDGRGKLYTFAQKVQKFLLKEKMIEKEANLDDFINPKFVIEYYNSL